MMNANGAQFPVIPPVGSGKRGESGYLTYLIRQANGLVRRAIDRRLTPLGLTFPQYTSLIMIQAYQDLSGADLARLTMLSAQTVNGVVHLLDRAGLITRSPHPSHGKVLCLRMTDLGLARLEEARQAVKDVEAILTEGTDADGIPAIKRWLGLAAERLATEA